MAEESSTFTLVANPVPDTSNNTWTAELKTTGGVPVGKYIAQNAGYRRTVLELGGNAPLIVMEDADLEKAATLAVQGATKNSGQRCTAVKRVLCVEAVADAGAARASSRPATAAGVASTTASKTSSSSSISPLRVINGHLVMAALS